MRFASFRNFALAGLLAAVSAFAPGAQAATTYTVYGNEDSNNVAEFSFNDVTIFDATGFTVSFTVKNISPLYSPTITGIALNLPTGVTAFNSGASTIPTNWNTFFEYGGVETPQPLGQFDFCAESGNGDKNCTGGNPNDGIAKGGSFAFTLRFDGDFSGGAPSLTSFLPLAARFQETGVTGEGSDVAICMDEDCGDDGGDIPDVPEPSTMLLFGGALLGLGIIRKKRNS